MNLNKKTQLQQRVGHQVTDQIQQQVQSQVWHRVQLQIRRHIQDQFRYQVITQVHLLLSLGLIRKPIARGEK